MEGLGNARQRTGRCGTFGDCRDHGPAERFGGVGSRGHGHSSPSRARVRSEVERRAAETTLDCVREHGLDSALQTPNAVRPGRADFRKLVGDRWHKYRARIWIEKLWTDSFPPPRAQ
eukprot:TRINITY_DN32940_c0_g1_i1.p4 TRINITY_DN32940_c0_g1~~TRINITY_DN32940_c0_g1_i1.p4  ORF type:complete len:117 (+),score=8.56 TRINITY_DN32940_c0_g1_i1:258-608(+)